MKSVSEVYWNGSKLNTINGYKDTSTKDLSEADTPSQKKIKPTENKWKHYIRNTHFSHPCDADSESMLMNNFIGPILNCVTRMIGFLLSSSQSSWLYGFGGALKQIDWFYCPNPIIMCSSYGVKKTTTFRRRRTYIKFHLHWPAPRNFSTQFGL